MRSIIITILGIITAGSVFAQQAQNFQSNDCSGKFHNFFKELDSGKVIVLCWVMPCNSCIGPAMTSYNIVKNMNVEFPGRVSYFLVDDLADTPCQTIVNWSKTYTMLPASFLTLFSNSAIKMSDYGTSGMPKVVVIGSNHQVYYNQNNVVVPQEIVTAIKNALITTSVEQESTSNLGIQTITPNPTIGKSLINFTLGSPSDVHIEIVDCIGQIVSNEEVKNLPEGSNTFMLGSETLSEGFYFARIRYLGGYYISSFIIKK